MSPENLDRWLPQADALIVLGYLKQARFTYEQQDDGLMHWKHKTWPERYTSKYHPIRRAFYIKQTAGKDPTP